MDVNAIINELVKVKQERDAAQAKFSGILTMARALQKTGTLTPEQNALIEKTAPTKQRTAKDKGNGTAKPATPGGAAVSR